MPFFLRDFSSTKGADVSKVYSRSEIIEVLSYMDEYSHSGQHREGAAIIRQLMAEIESLESDCERRVQMALIHGKESKK